MKSPNPCVLLSYDLLYTKFTLHINLHILLMFVIMASLKIQNSRQYDIYIKRYIQNTIAMLKIMYIYI